MGLETDLLIDRRRLKRRLALWRGFAVLLVAGAAMLWLARVQRDPRPRRRPCRPG